MKRSQYKNLDKILLSPQDRRKREGSKFFHWEWERDERVVMRNPAYKKLCYFHPYPICKDNISHHYNRVRIGPPFFNRMNG